MGGLLARLMFWKEKKKKEDKPPHAGTVDFLRMTREESRARKQVAFLFMLYLLFLCPVFYLTSRVPRDAFHADVGVLNATYAALSAHHSIIRVTVVSSSSSSSSISSPSSFTGSFSDARFPGVELQMKHLLADTASFAPPHRAKGEEGSGLLEQRVDDHLATLPSLSGFDCADSVVYVVDTGREVPAALGNRVIVGRYEHAFVLTGNDGGQPVDVAAAIEAFVWEKYLPLRRSVAASSETQDEYTVSLTLAYSPRASAQAGDPIQGAAMHALSADFPGAVRARVGPFLSALEPALGTKMDSQAVHFADIVSSSHDAIARPAGGGVLSVPASALTNFADTASHWNVGSPLTTSALEFMMYVHDLGAAGNHTRLAFVDEAVPEVHSNAFTIPNWGGLVLVGDPDSGVGLVCECAAVVSQLREVLGLDAEPEGVMWRAGDVHLAPWERRVLLDARLHMYLGKTYDQLLSLLELLDSVSVLPVNAHVAGNISLVMDTLSELQAVLLGSGEGKAQGAAHRDGGVCGARVEASVVLARRALHASTSAFFDPTMLPLLYFPQEFIYAVYFPFMTPLIMAMLSACKQQHKEEIVD